MFSPEEILKLKIYCQTLTSQPRAMNAQPFIKRDGYFFLDDWEIIEILKFFFNGESYWPDPPPNRLVNNPLWKGKEDVAEKAKAILKEYETVDNIIEYFKKRRGV